MQKLTISYDIGHSSIGWAVLNPADKLSPEIIGCGSVIFPKDDCLASSRRDHRRMRRNIRSTRQRIERLKLLLLHLGVLTDKDLNQTGHSAPYALAAKALSADEASLSWLELWHIIRWYAHNRGYDGNSRWSKQEEDSSDTDKEKAAIELMQKYETSSMAETICAHLELNLEKGILSSRNPYKTLNAAFPRTIVQAEITTILEKHIDVLPKLNQNFIDTLIASDDTKGKQAWRTIVVPEINLPRRYFGGLLFGQLIPRFDNRIIAICPFTGDKVPNKGTMDFLLYRWAMIIANIKADGKTLTREQRSELHSEMLQKGRFTATELRVLVEKITGTKDTNLKAYFGLHPDAADALVLDPALSLYHGEGVGSKSLKPYWNHLPKISQRRALGRWKKGRVVSLQWMLDECDKENHDKAPLEKSIDKEFSLDQKKSHSSYATLDHLLKKSYAPKALSGRAPYSRKCMKETVNFVLNSELHPTAEGGPLYRSKEILKNERNRSIDEQTNNHLIRQRLTILLRLTKDIIADYADNDSKNISDLVVEVARDLQEYSGLTAKEMAGELTKRLSHFKSAVAYLEEHAPNLTVTGSLIRKCRIAMDMNWTCPFTGKKYDAQSLPALEREHIIPYADRPSNSLDSLVLTFEEVNKLKAKRTGMQFIKDMSGDDKYHTPKQYEAFVKKLKTANKDSYPDDYRRQMNRKKLMMIEKFEVKEQGFTQGALTQTSHLNRLSARQLEKLFVDPLTDEPSVRITSIPGQVTAETRKSWGLLGCLAQASPDILFPSVNNLENKATEEADKELKKQMKAGILTEKDRDEIVQKFIDMIPEDQINEAGNTKNKTDIRNVTHLHHALDAATLALTHHYLPGSLRGQKENEKGAIWQALLKRKKSSEQIVLLMRTGVFEKSADYGIHLRDINPEIKNQLAQKLAEMRVIQHIPADQSGAALQLNAWNVALITNDSAILTQRPNRELLELEKENPDRKWKDLKAGKKELLLLEQCKANLSNKDINLIKRGIVKIKSEKTAKLIGLHPGKLKANNAVLIIESNYGIALMEEPEIIPFHNIPARLEILKKRNLGEAPQLLRNGMIIRIEGIEGKDGLWRIFSSKAPAHLDIARLDVVSMESKGERYWRQVSVKSLIKKNAITIIDANLTGVNAN